jgi:hypothetical protein
LPSTGGQLRKVSHLPTVPYSLVYCWMLQSFVSTRPYQL